MRQGAQYVEANHGGLLPSTGRINSHRCICSLFVAVSELLKVPGIGPYTAGAIASIAFGQPAAIVDGMCPAPAAVAHATLNNVCRKRDASHDQAACMGG